MSNIKLYLIKFAVLKCGKIGIAEVAAESAKRAQEILQANGKYNGYKYAMEYPELVHTTDTFTAEALISELDNPAGEKGDRGPRGLKGDTGERGPRGEVGPKGDKGDPGLETNGYYPEMSVGMADKVKGVNKVQEELTLTTKPNGNIVIGNLAGQSKEFMPATPSGDPMHYAYEVAGAVWNEDTGYWELNGLSLTKKEILDIYNESLASWTCAMEGLYAYSAQRTNFAGRTVSTSWGYLPNNSVWMFLHANTEVARVSNDDKTLEITNALGMFFRAYKLRSILGVIDFANATETSEMFKECYALEDVRCANLKQNISFAYSPLSVESATYMLANASASSSFTITFRADRQAIFEANSDFRDAKSAKPNITILYQ